jgi:TetR/AcrR family transcriptional regulator
MAKHIKDSEETKRKIIHAAKKEFANKGFSGARMSSIASIAGVNQALLHYHFESKENLYVSIFHYFVGDSSTMYAEQIDAEIESWNVTIDVELCAVIYFLIGIHFESHDDEMNKIFAREIAEGTGVLHEFVKKYMLPRLVILEGIIKDGIKTGIFEVSNPKMFTLNMLSFITDFVHGEDFLKGTEWHDELFRNKKETLYKYMLEQSFKTLRPAKKELKIPLLDKDKMAKMDSFVKMINDFMSNI